MAGEAEEGRDASKKEVEEGYPRRHKTMGDRRAAGQNGVSWPLPNPVSWSLPYPFKCVQQLVLLLDCIA